MKCLLISTTKYISGPWNVIDYYIFIIIIICIIIFSSSVKGIGRVALDVRLGCLDPNLSPNSEPQKIIDAAKYALRNVAILELKFPFWRYFPTTIWTNYVNNMNYFIE